jgi:hypothetical protein
MCILLAISQNWPVAGRWKEEEAMNGKYNLFETILLVLFGGFICVLFAVLIITTVWIP